MGDADCTYDFRELEAYVREFHSGQEFVKGSRWKGTIERGSMPPLHRNLGPPITTWIMNVMYGSDFSDIHCGMRGITLAALKRMGLQSQSWEYASEMVLKSVHMRLRTSEVPVRFLKDRERRVSHHRRTGWYSPFHAAWMNLRAMFVYGVEFFALKPGLSMLLLGLPFGLLGVWLSARQLRRHVTTFQGKRLADVGCGYQAAFARSVLDEVESAVLLDVAIEPALGGLPRVRLIEGLLPRALDQVDDSSVDVLVCNSVLEHLWEPLDLLGGFWRVLAAGGVALVNVPSWAGKRFLEASAFRFGLSPAAEVDDHKAYYDPSDLWPLLVRAGFRPRHISCFRHKFGLNTFACCRKLESGP